MSVQRRGDLAGGGAASRGPVVFGGAIPTPGYHYVQFLMPGIFVQTVAFGSIGAVLVLGGVVSVVTGAPRAAHGLAPLAGIADLGGRFSEFSLLLSAAIAALVAATIVALLAARRLRSGPAGFELLVLGAAVEICVMAAGSRVGYAVDGTVLPATVACLTGGAALIAAGVVAILEPVVASAGPRR